ncbi:hypothetical protein V8E54_012397 [Elaphomyces granulatus]
MSQPSTSSTSSRTVSPVPTERNLDPEDDALAQPGCKDNSTDMCRFHHESLVNHLLFISSCFAQDSRFRDAWEAGHKQGFSSCRPETHSPDASPPWNAFVLYSVAMDDKKFEVLICPTTDFHFAVPVVRILKEETPVFFSPGAATLLWKSYNLWYYDGRVPDLRYVCVLNRVTLWSSLMDFLVRTSFSSLNEIRGILALRRTIARCLPIYVTLGLAALGSEFFGFLQWRVCVEQSRLWDQALEEQMGNPQMASVWKSAVESIGLVIPRESALPLLVARDGYDDGYET